eukprot:TRINITY_DN74_c0_g1_i3.p1 TRINITY_DN74_c0_g1~~TRINITY_DN74_c0_g1_i3.p1  ORF type:complete len:76 (+),score=12.50 TRINITY_DN74_c0_g1_i3:96-323(+)
MYTTFSYRAFKQSKISASHRKLDESRSSSVSLCSSSVGLDPSLLSTAQLIAPQLNALSSLHFFSSLEKVKVIHHI